MNAATHEFSPEEVMAFLDGELSDERAAAVSNHVKACADCSALAADFRGLSGQMSNWQPTKFPSGLGDAATPPRLKKGVRGVSRLGAVPKWRPSSPLRWAVIAGSSVAALLLLTAITAPNLLRSRMAANEASPVAMQRSAETERILGLYKPPASPSAGPVNGRGPGDDVARLLDEKGRNQLLQTLEQPMIARTVSLSIVAKDFESARPSLDPVLARHNGYAAALNVATPQGAARTLQASLRIPTPQLAAALSELKALGRVEIETQNGEEVTQQHADLLARLKNSRETEQRLQDVLRTRTGKVKDVLEVEEEIARVRGEIEQMEAEQKNLEHRVEFATIDLKLSEEYKAQLTTPAPSVFMQLRNATINGFRNAFESFMAIILFFAESGPTLVLWLALLFFPARFFLRRYQRLHTLGSSLGA